MKKIAIYIAVLAIAVAGLFGAEKAHANPYVRAYGAQTASATTSAAYVGNGLATSTLQYDSYATSATSNGATTIPLQAVFAVQYSGSSTASILNIRFEYSDDGVDWYQDGLSSSFALSTSSYPTVNLTQSVTYQLTAASSTIGGRGLGSPGNNGGGATTTTAFLVRTPVRFTRAIIFGTGGAGAVWAQFIPTKERAE